MEIFDEIINILDRIETEIGYKVSNQDIDYERNIINYLDDLEIYVNDKQIGNEVEHLYSYYVAEKYE